MGELTDLFQATDEAAIRHALRPSIVRLAVASSIGTTLEWYDFTVYNIMAAVVFNVVFFPSFDPLAGTLLAFSTYAVGYLSRPLGGVVFGHLGDRLGRRFVLVATLLLMGIATGLMGLLPTYKQWGVWSPMFLVLLRFVQGAAIGGEWAGAVLLSLEHGAAHQRGRNASFAQMGPACGTILGTGVVAAITLSLSVATFETWGWRIPFWLSVGLVAFGLWLRRGVEETPTFVELVSHHATAKAPIKEVISQYRRPLLTAIGARVGPDVVYALLVVFTLTYVTTVLHLSRPLALTVTMIGAACHAVAIPWFGTLSDRIGRRPVYAVGTTLSILWAFAYFRLIGTGRPLLIGVAVAGGMTLHAMMYGPQAAFITEQFPSRVRYAGASLAYTITGVVAGGFAPLIFAAIYGAYGSTMRVSLYVIAALAVTLVALWYAQETAKVPLAN
jgi:MFS family permease